MSRGVEVGMGMRGWGGHHARADEVVGAELRMAPVGRCGYVFLFNKKLPMLTELDAADTLDMSIGIWIVGGVCDTLADRF